MKTDRTICLNSKVDGKQPYIEDRIYYGGGISVGITATFGSYGYWVMYEEYTFNNNDMGKIYRIRKLSPRECLRLMAVSDEDIDKMIAAGISDSQLYKMAGNSIVVNVLEGIFTQMFRKDTECLF